MYLNTVLAIIIVLLFILFFALWLLLAFLGIFASPSSELLLKFLIPGAAFFGFWFLVAYRLYNCPGDPLSY